MAADEDGTDKIVFDETCTLNSEESLPPGWEVRSMDDGRIYYAK